MPSVSTSITCAAGGEPVDHLLQKLTANLGNASGCVEIGEVTLGETEVAIKAVDQDLEGVLERVEVLLLGAVFRGAHAGFRFQAEGAQVGEQMAKDLELVGRRPAIELEHDRRVKRRDIAMPDVAGDAGEKDRGVTALEPAHHRHLRNRMAL